MIKVSSMLRCSGGGQFFVLLLSDSLKFKNNPFPVSTSSFPFLLIVFNLSCLNMFKAFLNGVQQ
jgi:hypothetical protein